jgi:hypothetical protein
MFDYKANKHVLCDSLGRRLTTGLFQELADPLTKSKPVFKLVDWREVYIDIADPTDYKAAMELIGDWEHWKMLVANPVFNSHLEEWRAEVVTKIKSQAIVNLRTLALSPQGTAAAKYLAEHGYLPKKSTKKKEAKQEEDTTAEDAKRLGLRAVK